MAKKKGGARKKSSSKKSQTAGRKKKKPAAPAPIDVTNLDRIISLARIKDLRHVKGKTDLQFGGFKLTSSQISKVVQLIDQGVELKVTIEPEYYQPELPLNGGKKKKPVKKSSKRKAPAKKKTRKKAAKKKK
jgi:hypothetical protein